MALCRRCLSRIEKGGAKQQKMSKAVVQMSARESWMAGTGCLRHKANGERHASLHVAQWVKVWIKRLCAPLVPHNYGCTIFAE